jgi:hypothetical protein
MDVFLQRKGQVSLLSVAAILIVLCSIVASAFAADPKCHWTAIYDQSNNCIDVTANDDYDAGSHVYITATWEDVSTGQWSTGVAGSSANPLSFTITPPGAQEGNQYVVEVVFTQNSGDLDAGETTIVWGDTGSGTASGSTDTTSATPSQQDAGGPFSQVFAGLIDDLTNTLSLAADALGFEDVDKMIFNAGLTDDQKNLAPFGQQQMWDDAWKWYVGIASGAFVLILIAICITALKFIASPFNKQMKEDAVESMWRWLLSVLIVAGAPVLCYVLIRINNGLVDLFVSVAQSVRPGSDLKSYFEVASGTLVTGNVIYTAVVKLMFSGVRLWLGVLFEVRELVLLVIFIFTPLMAILWALNKNVNAAGIWLGEVVSNIFMQCAYAFVFLILMTFITVAPQGSSTTLSQAGVTTLNQAVSDIVSGFGLPIGGTLLLGSVCWIAIQIAVSRFNADKKESLFGNISYVGIGGVVLGSVIFFGSLLFSIAKTYFGFAFNATAGLQTAIAAQPANGQNMITILIWLMAMLPVAEMIRNSMQGLFTRHSEFDEAGFATRSLAAIAGIGGMIGLSNLGRATFGHGMSGRTPGGGGGWDGGAGHAAGQGIKLTGSDAPLGGGAGSVPAPMPDVPAVSIAGVTPSQSGVSPAGGLQRAVSWGEKAGAFTGGVAGAATSSFVSGAIGLAGCAIPGGQVFADVGRKAGSAAGMLAEHGVGAVTRGVATHGHLFAQSASYWVNHGSREGDSFGESFQRVSSGKRYNNDASGTGNTLARKRPTTSIDGYRGG